MLKATFALLQVRLLSVLQIKMSILSSLANGDKLHHNHQLRKSLKSLLSMISAEDVLAAQITAAVVHSKNHGPMSARQLE